ncbi:MAG: hypothetical protein MUF81_17580 [Verrucomicrobia bacterium]|nr:hypothetical protein [Verrucomicrobiota bacterium]
MDVDLSSLAQDTLTASSNLLFAVNSPVNRTVTLVADGHPARFALTPNFTGLASFKFSTTDTWPDSRLLAAYDFESPDDPTTRPSAMMKESTSPARADQTADTK